MSNINFPKPIIKWVGGKSQIMDKIIPYFPTEINDYHEIFIGGGSVLLSLLKSIKSGTIRLSGKVYAYDLNESLIKLYKNIQENHIELYSSIKKIVDEYNSCNDIEEKEEKENVNRNPSNLEEAKQYKENYYYWIRNKYNKDIKDKNTTVNTSAMFVFLNKTCFRGLYRVGPNGFNVPFGNYKNPEIINLSHLKEIHELIKDVVFEHKDYNVSLEKKFNENDFVYLDPPYVPEKKTSFVGYNENGFNTDEHIKLFNKINQLNTRFLMNNSDVKLVRDSFSNEKYNIVEILCKRSINSKKPNSKTIELIIIKK